MDDILVFVVEGPSRVEECRRSGVCVGSGHRRTGLPIPSTPELVDVAMVSEKDRIPGGISQVAHVLIGRTRCAHIVVDQAVRVALPTAAATSGTPKGSKVCDGIQGVDPTLCPVTDGQIAAPRKPGVSLLIPKRIRVIAGRGVGSRQRADTFPVPVGQTKSVQIAHQRAKDALVVVQVRTMPWKEVPRAVNLRGDTVALLAVERVNIGLQYPGSRLV
jgi:hypothetical protein